MSGTADIILTTCVFWVFCFIYLCGMASRRADRRSDRFA